MSKQSFGWAIMASVAAGTVVAEPLVTNTYTLYGTPGLIEMPTAESAPDAELSVTTAIFGDDLRNTLSFQITPRLSGSFRYTKLPGYNLNNSTDRYDRSFDLRFRFLDEGKYLPAMAIGLQDFVGTGVYSGEYIVATKSFGDKLRVSGGLGWGKLGSNDPVFSVGKRPTSTAVQGGQANTAQWFRGDAAVFAGMSYAVNDRLTFKAEYSSDAYTYETGKGLITPKSQMNYGVDYALRGGIHVAASYNYGDRLGFQVTLPVNPKRAGLGPDSAAGPLPVAPRPARASNPTAYDLGWTQQPGTVSSLRSNIQASLAKDGIELEAMALDGTRAELRIRNKRYPAAAQALGRTARILSRGLPASVETFVITPVVDGVPNANVTFARSDIEQLENVPSDAILAKAQFGDAAGRKSADLVYSEGMYPRFTWNLGPYVSTSYFDPDEPVRGEVGVRLSGTLDVAPGVVIDGSIRKRIVGNLDGARPSNSALAHVRTDGALYAQQSDLALDYLTLSFFGRPGTDLYSRATVGYMEQMYAGVSGEVLWKPVDSRLALGAELNYVKKRAFDGGFGFQNYEILTGHASAYYSFGNGFHGQLDVGRYLAGDYGATVTLDREFANGWRVGAFATLTDVSAAQFGEGSFDKGIRLTIPVAWALGEPTRSQRSTVLRPLTRDGGARLNVTGRLYERVREDHKPDTAASWGRFWR